MNCSSVRNSPMPSAPDWSRCGRSNEQPGIDVERHARAVERDRRHACATRHIGAWRRARKRDLVGISRDDFGRRPQMQFAAFGVDDRRGRRPRPWSSTPLAWLIGGNAERAGHDGDMARRRRPPRAPAPRNRCAVVIEQLGRAHIAGDENRVLRQRYRPPPCPPRRRGGAAAGWRDRRCRAAARAHKDRSGASCARGCRCARARRRLRRSSPVCTASSQPPQPAAIVGEHAEGFEHLAMLAGARQIAALRASRRSCRSAPSMACVEPRAAQLDVLGDQLGDHDARLVQHHMAERHAFGDARPVKRGALVAARVLRPRRLASRRAGPRRSSRRAPWRWSAAPRLPRRYRWRWVRFCTVSTPMVWPPRKIGTPRKEW